MWKLLGALAIFLICAALGGTASENLRKRVDMLSSLTADLKTVRGGMKNENKNIGNIVSELSANGNIPEFWKEMKRETDLNRPLREALEKSKHIICGLNKKDMETLENFVNDFGTGDMESELTRLNALIAEFDGTQAALKRDYPKKAKLMRSLSALGGIALALILL